MTDTKKTYVHFDKLCEFMIAELFRSNASPLAFAIGVSHCNKLPQYKYRVDISQPLLIDLGLDVTDNAIEYAVRSIPNLINAMAPGIIRIAPEAIKQLSEASASESILIVNQISSEKKPAKKRKNKKDWSYANALFAGPEKAFYDYAEGNQVINKLKKNIKDMEEFCDWRLAKNKPALPTIIEEVMREYDRYKAPPIDLNAMLPAKKKPEPVYRKVDLTGGRSGT